MRIPQVVDRLRASRREFGPRAGESKARLLRRASTLPLTDVGALIAYHDTLLFNVAYPDSSEVRGLAEGELRRIARAVRALVREGTDEDRAALAETGIAHSELTHGFTIDASSWLADRFSRDAELDWRDESLGHELDEFLPALAARAEADGTVTRELSTKEWFALAKGGSRRSDLSWLIELFRRLDCGGVALDRVFESFDLQVRWRLRDAQASRTLNRFPARRTFYQAGALRRGVPGLDRLERPIPRSAPLPLREARQLLDVCRAALCVRGRETDPLTYASPHEVMLIRLERGIDVAVFGMVPERRLPLDSFFGYVVARNRLPVGYGGGWVFLDSCQIGINIFDDYRGGESAEIFSAILRAYRQLFRPKLFSVPTYQIGADNEDAIRSGAYWFYDRFGFRPMEPELRRLAARERSKMKSDLRYRSPARVLRRLAHSRLALVVEGDVVPEEAWVDVEQLGLRVTKWIGERFEGDRSAAERGAVRRVARALGASGVERWPEGERHSFRTMSVLAAMLPGLARWPAAEKKALLGVLRAKGGRRERTFARRLTRHPRLGESLRSIARRPI